MSASLLAGCLTAWSPLLSQVQARDDLPVRTARLDANGIVLNVAQQGEGPAVVFCHGFPDTSATWLAQMPAIAAAGYRAIALDMRGYGLSDAPANSSMYTSYHVVNDLVGVLDALRVSTAVLVGHDWGSAYAWQALLRHPDRFTAAIGISVPYVPRGETSFYDILRHRHLERTYYGFEMIKPDADRLWRPASRTIPSALYWASASPPPSQRWDPFDPNKSILRPAPAARPRWIRPEYLAHQVRTFARTGFHGGLNYYRAAQLDFEETAAYRGAVIPQPTLYICGRADGLQKSFRSSRQELQRALPGLTDYIVFDDVGHWVQHEAPDRLNVAILGFLAGMRKRHEVTRG